HPHPTLPAARRAPSPAAAMEGARIVSTTTVPDVADVLVVDDEPLLRGLLDAALRRHGYGVLLADNGAAAVRLYRDRRERIGLVLLDVRMPVLDGPQTLRALQQIDPAVRCCFMSGNVGDHAPDDLLALGALHFLEKPFRLDDLLAAVGRLVSPPGG